MHDLMKISYVLDSISPGIHITVSHTKEVIK
jgi:hypothetical protein